MCIYFGNLPRLSSSSQSRISCAAIFAYDLAVKLESCALADTARGTEQVDCATIWASHKLRTEQNCKHITCNDICGANSYQERFADAGNNSGDLAFYFTAIAYTPNKIDLFGRIIFYKHSKSTIRYHQKCFLFQLTR